MIAKMHLHVGVVLALVGFVLLFFYKLDDRTMQKIREEKAAKFQTNE